MTAPSVNAAFTGQTTTNGTSHAVTLPAVITRGDLILLFCASDGNPTMTAPSGWQTVMAATPNSTAVSLAVFGKSCDGTEDSASVTWTTGASEQTSTIGYRITGWSGTVTDIRLGTAATGTSTGPNPPSLNPADYATEDFVWFSFFGSDSNRTVSSGSTGFNTNQLAGSSTNNATVGVGWLAETINVKDPSAYVISGSDEWVAQTLCVFGTKTYLTETFEAATPAGTALSSSNTAFNTYNGSDTSVTSDTTPVPDKGLLYGQFVGTTNTRTAKSLNTLPGAANGGTAHKQLWMRFYFRIQGGAPAVATRIAVMEESAAGGGSDIATIRLQTDGTLRLGDVATYPGSGTSHAFTDAHWHRIEWWVDQESDYQEIRCWWGADRDDPSTSPANGFYESINYVTTSVDAIEGFGIGLYTGGNAIELMYDDVAVAVGGWIGPTAPGATAATGTGSLTLGATATAQAAATSTGSLTLGATAAAQAVATATGSLTLAGTAAWVVPSVTGSLTLAGTAAWVVPSVTGSLTLGATGTARGAATATGTLTLAATATAGGAATVTGSLTLAGTAAWIAPPVSGSITLGATAAAKAAATATGSLSLSGTATSQAVITATGSLSLSGTATWVVPSVTGSLSLSGTATSQAVTTATGSLALSGTANWVVPSVTGSLSLSGTATSQAVTTATGSLALSGTANWVIPSVTGSLSLSGTATSQAVTTATGSLSLSGTATAAGPGTTASGSIALNGSVAAAAAVTASGSLSLSGTATSQAVVTATGSLALSGTATSQAVSTATGSLSLSGTATSQAVTTATGSLTLSGTATAAPGGVEATATGSLSLSGTSTSQAVTTATGSLSLSGTATSQAVTTATGSLALSGAVMVTAAGMALGTITLNALVAAAAQVSALGLITLTGGATAVVPRNVTVFTASITQPHYAVTAAQREAAVGAITRRSAVAAPQGQTATAPDRRNAEAIP